MPVLHKNSVYFVLNWLYESFCLKLVALLHEPEEWNSVESQEAQCMNMHGTHQQVLCCPLGLTSQHILQ